MNTHPVPSEFFARMKMLYANIGATHWPTVAIAAASLAIILFWTRLTKRLPGSIIALFLATAARAGDQ